MFVLPLFARAPLPIIATPSGTKIVLRFVQPSNSPAPMEVRPDNTTFESEQHPPNIVTGRLFCAVIVTVGRFAQLEKSAVPRFSNKRILLRAKERRALDDRFDLIESCIVDRVDIARDIRLEMPHAER